MTQDPNLPGGCTQADCDGGVVTQPDNEAVHKYACDNWRDLLSEGMAFEDVEVDSHDDGEEETSVLVTVRVLVPWWKVGT